MPHKPKLDGTARKVSTTKRVGPPCATCARPLPVSDVPKSEEDLAKLAARVQKLAARYEKSKGITVVAK